jgi:hypothetical protein
MGWVPPSGYLLGHGAGPRHCCKKSVPQRPDYDLVPSDPSRVAYGPNAFFCDEHRQATLASQYRHLPALAHARASLWARWEEASLKWLILLDDDSFVSVPKLVDILRDYDHMVPLQLGDFILSSLASPDRSWERYFACGGAGTILSGAAVLATKFGICHHAYRRSCLQSDWMINACTMRYNVSALPDPGCHACADESGGSALLYSLQHGCLSAQYADTDLPFVTRIEDEALRRKARALLISRPAIVHVSSQEVEERVDPGLNMSALLLSKAAPVSPRQRTREQDLAHELRARWESASHENRHPEQMLNVRRCAHTK